MCLVVFLEKSVFLFAQDFERREELGEVALYIYTGEDRPKKTLIQLILTEHSCFSFHL